MARGSREFSSLVFIRNVTTNLENYSFDYEMLEIFYAVDGNKTVAAVAADLGKTIPDVKAAFERLSRQKLILSAPRGVTSVSPPPLGEKEVIVIDKHSEISRLDIRDLDDLISEVSSEDEPVAVIAESARTEPPEAAREKAVEKGNSPASHDNLSILSPQPLLVATDLLSMGDDGPSETPQDDPFAFLDSTESEEKHGSNDLFSFRNPERTLSSDTPFDAFTRTSVVKHHEPDVETPFTLNRSSQRSAGFPSTDRDQGTGDPEEELLPPNAKGIEYFENGLAALQDKLYKEALIQFELAIDLDPQNRLCRANIQRIKQILGEDAG
jgi:hypothetical protein